MEELKSLCLCKCVLILSFLMTISGLSNQNIIDDLPVTEDFPRYFIALKNAIDFIISHKYYVDLNLQFGLFLVDSKIVLYYDILNERVIV